MGLMSIKAYVIIRKIRRPVLKMKKITVRRLYEKNIDCYRYAK